MKKNCSIFFHRFQLAHSSYSFVSMEGILLIGAAYEHATEKTSSAEWVLSSGNFLWMKVVGRRPNIL